MLLSSYFGSWDVINFKIFLESTSKAMADREKKWGRRKYKNWISWEWKELFRWNKEHLIFHSFWRATIWWKIKISWKIVDTSFKKQTSKNAADTTFKCFNQIETVSVQAPLCSQPGWRTQPQPNLLKESFSK